MVKMFRVLGKRGRVTIPHEIRQRVGFGYNDILSFTEAADGRTVVIRREKSARTARAYSLPQRRTRSRCWIS